MLNDYTQVSSIVEDLSDKLDYSLSRNFPNPFNPSTNISWQSPIGGYQTLRIYDMLGNEGTTLIDEFKPTGNYEIKFNARDLSAVIYLYGIQTSSFVQTKK